MFLLLGGALGFVVGLVGILNFANAILTGIAARRRELAVLGIAIPILSGHADQKHTLVERLRQV